MNMVFRGMRIAGILTVLPKEESRFEDEAVNYGMPPEHVARYRRTIGVDRHRVAPPGVSSSDLCVRGLEYLRDKGLVALDEIDVLLFVSQTPDYVMPPTSNVIQGRLKLANDVFCLDINQGCAGYIVGLIQAFMMLSLPGVRRVALCTAEISSRQHSTRNRASYPLVGDGAAITIVEHSSAADAIYANLKMDGARGGALLIPAGGARTPASERSVVEVDCGEGIWRSQHHVVMDGSAVFQFTVDEVPPMVAALLAQAGVTDADVDYYMFHQPNRLMLENIARRMKVPVAKMPNDMVGIYGNLSSASIPATIAHHLGARLLNERLRLCLAGFGVGLSWGSMYVALSELRFNELIDL